MDRDALLTLLTAVAAGERSPHSAVDDLRKLPFEPLQPNVKLDHHRELRSGVPEVIYGEGKTAEDIASILVALDHGSGALATRISRDKASDVCARVPDAEYRDIARLLVVPARDAVRRPGRVVVASAGTSDQPVAEEAAVTAEFLGHSVERFADIGVAGLHRLLSVVEDLRAADCVIAIAGMEGALPTVIAGLVDRPIIAVPTSVGYGVGLGGYVAMMGMLASCAPGLSIVNIDNGFGAAVVASRIVRRTSGQVGR